MNPHAKFFIFNVAVVLLGAFCSTTWADDHCCDKCGCQQLKKRLKRIYTFQEVEVPSYECKTIQGFFPDKGWDYKTIDFSMTRYFPEHDCPPQSYVNNPGYGCRDCEKGCFNGLDLCKQCWVPYTFCDCKTVRVPKQTGCYDETCVVLPTKRVKISAPVGRWVVYYTCEECGHCCRRGGRSRH